MADSQDEAQPPQYPVKKRTLGDNLRQLKFNLTAVVADMKYIRRTVMRELKFFIPITDLLILFMMIGIIVIFFLVLFILVFPFFLSILINSAYGNQVQQSIFNFIDDNDIFRLAAALIGIVTIIVRLMVQSPINKYKDKVNARKDVTYVFGSSKPTEQFLYEMIFQYGYEEKVSLIADADLLWIRKLKALIDVYVVEDKREFEKPNLYEMVGFKNASRIMILSESVEINQNILTNIRQVRPDVEIIILSQYAPAFVFSDLIEDENLTLIEDLDVTVEGLVLSLSLDFRFPQSAEIDVPRTFIGHTGDDLSSDIPNLEVVLIRRNNELFPSNEKLISGDRIILFYQGSFDMKRINRVVTELPHKSKKKSQPDTEEIQSPTQTFETTEVKSLSEKTEQEEI